MNGKNNRWTAESEEGSPNTEEKKKAEMVLNSNEEGGELQSPFHDERHSHASEAEDLTGGMRMIKKKNRSFYQVKNQNGKPERPSDKIIAEPRANRPITRDSVRRA